MVSFGLMVLLMIVLSRVGKDGRPWRELFGLEFPEPLPKGVPRIAAPAAGDASSRLAWC